MSVPFESWSCEQLVNELTRLIKSTDKSDQDQLDELFDYFLFRYSPEKHFAVIKENAKILKNETLLDFVVNRAYKTYEPVIFLEAANVLASLGLLRYSFFCSVLYSSFYLFLLIIFPIFCFASFRLTRR
jgi:hypothetical protein